MSASLLWEVLTARKILPEEIACLTKEFFGLEITGKVRNIFVTDIEMIGGVKHIKINYHQIGCPRTPKLGHQARGIILSYIEGVYTPVCYPFDRFFNWNQRPLVSEIEWASARVMEKIDGSLLMLWFCPADKMWHFSSRGKITPIKDLQGAIDRALREKFPIDFGKLNRNNTYMFEFYDQKYAKVKIEYKVPVFLCHIGTRNIKTFKEVEYTILGISKPRMFTFESFEKVCTNKAEGFEGYVVVDGNYCRAKIKVPWYLSLIVSKKRHPMDLLHIFASGKLKEAVDDGACSVEDFDLTKKIFNDWYEFCHRICLSNTEENRMKLMRSRDIPGYLKGMIRKGKHEFPIEEAKRFIQGFKGLLILIDYDAGKYDVVDGKTAA